MTCFAVLTNIFAAAAAVRCFGGFIVSRVLRLLVPSRRIENLGKWVVITGATDGIGKAMSERIATRPVSLLLLGRDAAKLQDVKAEMEGIQSSYNGGGKGLEVRTLVHDFNDLPLATTATDNPLPAVLREAVKGLDVGLLVNNVGKSYDGAQYLHELTPSFIDSLVNVNLRSTMHMTRLVLPGMVQRKRGAIVCVGSGVSEMPCEPLYCVYAGVKGGIEAFCRSLQGETRPNNIVVQCHAPLLVTTKLSKVRTPSLTVPSTREYAKRAVASIEERTIWEPATVSPFPTHAGMLRVWGLLPQSVFSLWRLRTTSYLRELYMKKLARQEGNRSS